jgi:hypothetical protein
MSFYTYDRTHCIFDVQSKPLERFIDPQKVRFLALGNVCWTSLHAAKMAVDGVLRAKLRVLMEEEVETRRQLDMLDDWTECDDCAEPLQVEYGYGYPPEADHDLLCKTCYDVAMEN